MIVSVYVPEGIVGVLRTPDGRILLRIDGDLNGRGGGFVRLVATLTPEQFATLNAMATPNPEGT